MEGKPIPMAAVERNRAWIKAVTDSLGKRNDVQLLLRACKNGHHQIHRHG